MTFKWNLVAKNLMPHDQLQRKMRQKIARLEQHLRKFPMDAPRLSVRIERLSKRQKFKVALALRSSSNTVRSAKLASDPVVALDEAIKTLLRELQSLTAEPRHDKTRNRKRRSTPEKPKAGLTSPSILPRTPAAAPTSDAVAEALRFHYPRLIEHVRRRLERDEAGREIPEGAIDAASVVDEVARHALDNPGGLPPGHGYRVWFYRLALLDLRRRYQFFRKAARESVSLQDAAWSKDDAESVQGFDSEQPLKIIAEQSEPFIAGGRAVLADTHALSPEEELEHKDFIEYLQRVATGWPQAERDVFELHFLEGFTADEVAMIEGLSVGQTDAIIGAVHGRIRDLMMTAAVSTSTGGRRVGAG